jgi:hypothetical protein
MANETEMAPSSSESQSASGSPQVAEPVLTDSLSYWERQSATYNGVLGTCSWLSSIFHLISSTIEIGGYGSGVKLLSLNLDLRRPDLGILI